MKYRIITLLAIAVLTGCIKKGIQPPIPEMPDIPETVLPSLITVDCSQQEGPIMQLHRYNGSSTTSGMPGDAARNWMQQLQTKLVRVWIQLVYVYNNGNINYNYTYRGNTMKVEDALSFYSSCSDSLLIAMSGHKTSGSYGMPTGDAYKDLVRETILYYKRKYPKIKYIHVGNEVDHGGETMATYYPVYQYYYRGLNEANTILQAEYQSEGKSYDPILIGNSTFTGNITSMLEYAETFVKSYANDPSPNKKFDFFTFNSYGEANRPAELLTAKSKIDNMMRLNGLPTVPVIVSEYGIQGGSALPSGVTLDQMMLMQAAGQLAKAYYMYEGGINAICHWLVNHGSLIHKSQLLDVQNAYASPYGNMLVLSKMLADHKNRIKVTSKGLDNVGLGINAMAAADQSKGIAILVWNYNWTKAVNTQDILVGINNIPSSYFPAGRIHCDIYTIDSQNNNYYINSSQTSLSITKEIDLDYNQNIQIPLTLEGAAVSLIVLKPQ
ncbi:hypothetical protein [Niabella digestorum]|uniref:Uncharacterized protein n=1 Tax=Niabella digestorum TaxID=3117701 RepID=A0ABU7RFA2_9BACT